jgi:hypothetical protein
MQQIADCSKNSAWLSTLRSAEIARVWRSYHLGQAGQRRT